MNVYPVIMAGGGGTRFWPLSRKETPKQLLNLSGKDAMINETIARLVQVADSDSIFIVTNAAQAEKMTRITAGRVPQGNILKEPSARNTAACVGYAAIKILKTLGDGVMVVTPSDAYIRDEKEYARLLRVAIQAAEEKNALVTVGITPTFPATGYGYICCEQDVGPVKKVKRFVEKPDLETAKAYLASGDYVWNSGVFVWKASVILEKFRTLLPDIYEDLEKLAAAFGSPDEEKVLEKVYPQIRSISVDYGIMEKSDNILVVPGEFGWNDVGSWDMMNVLHAEDAKGNIALGDALVLDSTNTTVYAGSRLVAVVGVDDLVVVETEDAVRIEAIHRSMKKNFLPSNYVLLAMPLLWLFIAFRAFWPKARVKLSSSEVNWRYFSRSSP